MKLSLVWQPAAMGIARVGDPDHHLHAIALSLYISHFPVALLNQTLVLGKLMKQCRPSGIHPVIFAQAQAPVEIDAGTVPQAVLSKLVPRRQPSAFAPSLPSRPPL